jgi:hypothetical protein
MALLLALPILVVSIDTAHKRDGMNGPGACMVLGKADSVHEGRPARTFPETMLMQLNWKRKRSDGRLRALRGWL